MYQWNLTVERQLPWAMALEGVVRGVAWHSPAAVFGSKSLAVYDSEWAAVLAAFVANNTEFWRLQAGFTCRLTNPSWGGFSTSQGNGDSHYNSLEVNVTKRVTHGLQFQSSYTYAKLIDNGDGVAPSQALSTSNQTISILDEALDRGLASYDVRNNYQFNTIYNLPKMNISNHFVNGLVNGWWGAAIFAAENGYPFTPSIQKNRSRSNGRVNPSNLDRPNWAPGRNPYNATHGVSSGCTEGSGSKLPLFPRERHWARPAFISIRALFCLPRWDMKGTLAGTA